MCVCVYVYVCVCMCVCVCVCMCMCVCSAVLTSTGLPTPHGQHAVSTTDTHTHQHTQHTRPLVSVCNVYGEEEKHYSLDLRPDLMERFCVFSLQFSLDGTELITAYVRVRV